ncbi:MAG: hypothetical protein ACXAC2_06915, partial [Candidatus Kariarchaeaceae archaeon]
MKGKKFSSSLIFIIIIASIISLDVSRRYLSGEFGTELELEVLYSSEKEGWLDSVVDDFEKNWASNHA